MPTQGTAAYAAANSAMEECLAGRALTVAWGPWADTGMSRGTQDAALGAAGLHLLPPQLALWSLEAVLPMRGLLRVGLDEAHPAVRNLLAGAPRALRACTVFYEPDHVPPSELRRVLDRTRPLTDQAGTPMPVRLLPMATLPRAADGEPDQEQLLALAEGRDLDRTPLRTDLERLVAKAWQDGLGLAAVTLRENFFLLGGHSLVAAQILGRLRQELRVELPLAAFFQHPTVEGVARSLAATTNPERLETMARIRLEIAALSPEERQVRLQAAKAARSAHG
jgi:acyl carrier protein